MSNEPTYIKNLKTLARADPKSENFEALEREMYTSGSDRATAVLFASFVEINLENFIVSKLRPNLNSDDRKQLFDYEGAIGTFSSKIIIAYAFKLIGPVTRFDLNLIRILRNEFAHSRIPINFDTPEVKSVCDKLKLADLPASISPFGLLNRWHREGMEYAQNINHPKTRYICACHNASYRMHVIRSGLPHDRFTDLKDEPLP